MTTVDRLGPGNRGVPAAIREPGSILGSYRVLGLLGEGGMGVVYLAEHTRLGRRVALKTLRSELASNQQAVRRFFAEARAVNRISHHNIVEITDFVQDPGGDSYYIMELLQGESLADVLDRATPPLSRSLGVMIQVASALEAVHDAGIIHRDLKPDNVFLIEHAGHPDFVKILDFGVAELLELADDVTLSRTIVGTPEYMSPEQAVGMPLDHRSDIYAFGVILYELVTGTVPFLGSTFEEIVSKHVAVAPAPPDQLADAIPEPLTQLILECLAKNPGQRPASMEVVEARLREIADTVEGYVPLGAVGITARMRTIRSSASPPLGAPGDTEPVPTLAHAAPSASMPAPIPRSRLRAIAAVIVLVAALVGTGLAVRELDRAGRAPSAGTTAAGTAAPSEPDVIELRFESTPTGAEVFRAGRRVGATPLTLEVARSSGVEPFELRLAGRKSSVVEMPLDESSRVMVALVDSSRPGPAPRATTERLRREPPRRPRKPEREVDPPPPAPKGKARSVPPDAGFYRFD